VNARTCETFGYSREEFYELNVGSISSGVPPFTQEEASKRIQQTVHGHMLTFEWHCKAKEGGLFWVEVSTSKALLGKEERVLVSLQDITQRKRDEVIIHESEERYRQIVETATEGIIGLNAEGCVTYANGTTLQMFGYPLEELLGRPITDFMFPEDFADHERQITHRTTGIPGHYERRHKRKDGGALWCLISASAVMGADGVYQGTFAMLTDITERKQLEEQILFRALHDPLTGLANRSLCMDRIAQANERAARHPGSTFSVVFIDLDRFKVINDSLGHEAGDYALKEVAKRLLACARRVDTVCRYGGDEFILVLEDLSLRQTIRTIKRVRESLKAHLTISKHELQVEASFGIAYAPQENCQPEDLLRNANIALHQAKLTGRNKIVAYRRGMHEAAIHTMSLQGDMRRGLDEHEFFMVYQPLFHLESNRLSGFEALMRWRHPQRGIVSPLEFIPMAEESGFIFELGSFALSQACKDMVGLLLDLPAQDHLTVSVNLSPRQLSRQGLAEQIEQTLLTTGLPPSSLVLEITESSIMKYPEASAHILTRLKEKGVGIAIDDFGTGYSSMSALQKLPLDRLKVDMSFVSRMVESREDHEIIRAIITLARSLNLKTVAEGIETDEQRLALHKLHCDLGQGYLCSRPMLLADVPEAIRLMTCTQEL
jgi:diguanylate cyclase (GGDEF)-like protein/PAS domain S-box-containing protein